jgi:1-acyl-sn-glycerol-3-phosphate acyltransferase
MILLAWFKYCLIVLTYGIGYPLYCKLFKKEINWEFSQKKASHALKVLRISVECTGLDLLINSSKAGCIIVANHRSWFDSLALSSVLPTRTHFVAKEAYFSVPILGLWLKLYQHIPIDYSSPTPLKVSDLKFLRKQLNSGRIIVIYPEGTRSVGPNLLPFKRGAWWLGSQSRTNIIETYISGSDAIWPKGASIFKLKPGTISIDFTNSYSVLNEEGSIEESEIKFSNLHNK